MNDEIAIKQVGERVKAAREAANLTQEDLASLAGIEQKTLWRVEKALGQPRLSTIIKLIWALKLTPNEIIPYTE